MNTPLLIIGNKNYSSWSLRAWLLLKQFDINFNEQLIQLFDASATPTLAQYSATGKVPVLVINRDTENSNAYQHLAITDSLAIGIFANDYLTDLDIWSGKNKSSLSKEDITLQKQRGFCQSIVAEMHSSFMGVRNEMPMNIRATAKINPSNTCLVDLNRIEDIFENSLNSVAHNDSSNNYLFGDFTIADAFYAPVIFRLQTYVEHSGFNLRPTTHQYMDVMLNNPHMQQWREAALQEPRKIDQDEAGKILKIDGVLA